MPLVYAMTNSWSRAMVDRRKIIAVPSHCRCNWPFGLPSLPADSVRCPCALSLNHCARHVKTAMISPQLPVNNTFFFFYKRTCCNVFFLPTATLLLSASRYFVYVINWGSFDAGIKSQACGCCVEWCVCWLPIGMQQLWYRFHSAAWKSSINFIFNVGIVSFCCSPYWCTTKRRRSRVRQKCIVREANERRRRRVTACMHNAHALSMPEIDDSLLAYSGAEWIVCPSDHTLTHTHIYLHVFNNLVHNNARFELHMKNDHDELVLLQWHATWTNSSSSGITTSCIRLFNFQIIWLAFGFFFLLMLEVLPHSQPSIALNTLKWELSIFNSLRISNLSVCRRFQIRSNGSGHAENEIPTTRRDIDDLLCMRRRRPPRLVPLGPKQTKKKHTIQSLANWLSIRIEHTQHRQQSSAEHTNAH